jgi:hypothetical protein
MRAHTDGDERRPDDRREFTEDRAEPVTWAAIEIPDECADTGLVTPNPASGGASAAEGISSSRTRA